METMNQPKITGYRQLSEAEGALMNEIKEHAELTRELVNRVMRHVEDELAKPLPARCASEFRPSMRDA